jgi:hypothetical protein
LPLTSACGEALALQEEGRMTTAHRLLLLQILLAFAAGAIGLAHFVYGLGWNAVGVMWAFSLALFIVVGVRVAPTEMNDFFDKVEKHRRGDPTD